MDKDDIIKRLRVIYASIVDSEEDSEFDDPEFLTGKKIDFLTFRMHGDGDTMLHMACRRGELEAVKLLIELGLDVNIKGDMGDTALHLAAYHGYEEIYNYLILHGAKDNIVNEFSQTPKQYLEKHSK